MTPHSLKLSIFDIFPYSRPNVYQEALFSEDITFNQNVIIEAPVGSGKTVAVLSLAILEAIKKGLRGIIILTRTHSQMRNFLKELSKINTNFLVPYMGFIGKIHLCRFKEDPIAKEIIKFQGGCNAYACPFKEKYDQLINKDLKARMIWEKNKQAFLSITSISEHVRILSSVDDWCPYYLQKELMKFTRVIVTTYANSSKRMLDSLMNAIGCSLNNFIIIIDEAHNFSIPSKVVLPFDWISKGFRLIRTIELLEILTQQNETWGSDIRSKLNNALFLIDDYIMKKIQSKQKDIPPFVYETRLFLEMWSEGVATIEHDNAIALVPEIRKRIDFLNRAAKLILVSATISPFKIYSSIFGFSRPKLIKINEKRKDRHVFYSLKGFNITSKFSERTVFNFKKIADIIVKIESISSKKVLVICPSYDYALKLSNFLSFLYLETPSSSIEDLKNVVFSNGKSSKLVIAVNSGKILEGFDLVSSIGSVFDIVVFAGLPFTPPSWEKKVMKKYIAKKFSNSFSIILNEHLPVIRSLLQAVGRTTRNEHEKGLGIILDYRIEWVSKYIPVKVFQDLDKLLFSIHRFFGNSLDS